MLAIDAGTLFSERMPKLTFTDQNFEQEVLGEPTQLVLVDFWASWCGPCTIQRPIIDQIAEEYSGKAKIGELDVDANPTATGRYSILSIPTLILFKGGKVLWQAAGVQRKQKIIEQIAKAL